MRLLVFSDIHGNALALEALEKLLCKLSYDRIVFLGDVFGYYYNQEKCLEFLHKIPNLLWLKGNHDEYAWQLYFGEMKEERLISLYGHSYSNLNERFTDKEMEFLSGLRSVAYMETNGKKIGFFHGRPFDSLEGRIYGDTVIDIDEVNDFDVVFVGHTHCKIDRIIGKTRMLSPGSLGQPRDGRGYGFLLYDTETDECEYVNIDVDSIILRKQIECNDFDMKKLYDVLEREQNDAT